MKIIRSIISFVFLLSLISQQAMTQNTYQLKGRVLNPAGNLPVAGALVSGSMLENSIQTDSLGYFSTEVSSLDGFVSVWSPGYYTAKETNLDVSELKIYLVPESKLNYSNNLLLPFKSENINQKATSVKNISKEDLYTGSLFIDQAIQNAIPGLMVLGKSGMPGEGYYFNSRGASSIIGENAPLIVVNGIPYLPDMNESPVINGFSKSIFNQFSVSDIKNISFLRGADAAIYGSLGSNGVLLIETDDATDLETRVSFAGQYGFNMNTVDMPVMNVNDYKNYLGNIAPTRYEDMADILNYFPFLKDDPEYYYNFLYNNNTDWQKEIYRPAFVTENLIKIKGGDAVAKYDLSFGYLNQQGQIKNTDLQRYHMRLNANINVSQKIDFFTSMSLAYLTNQLQEQGMVTETNPIMAAMAKSPLLHPYKKDQYNNVLPDHSTIRDEDGNINPANAVSNPLAIVNTTSIASEGYNVMMSGGLNFNITNNFKAQALVGLYHNYNRSNVFIPGLTNNAIMPLSNGLAKNTVRMGIAEAFNMYYNINASYIRELSTNHSIKAVAGWQAITSRREFDAGEGRNTSSDFYKTLDNVDNEGRSFYGYINKWNWMNMFLNATYMYKNLASVGINATVDGASSTGPDTPTFGLFPSVNGAVFLNNMPFLANSSTVNKLAVRAEYLMTGNSNYSSNISDYYYINQVFRELSGIVRASIPSTNLKWENVSTVNAGIDFSGFRHNVDLTLDVYNSVSSDVILNRNISSVFGTDIIYDNLAEIQNQGVELGFQAYLLNQKNGFIVLGATAATNKNKVLSLGGEEDKIIEYSDGSAVIVKEGESAFSYYGYQTDGIYASTEEAESANLTDASGNPFGAGDVIFVNNVASDNMITSEDRMILGSSDPDVFGRAYTTFGFKQLTLTGNFIYSYGNEAYNALRREFETLDDFGNQLNSANRRWQAEGQITDMPRAVYNDPMDNGRFSDRFIEDASFIKLKQVTLSYTFKKGTVGFLRGGTIYISGENLFTLTNYLGADPEFSYSYDIARQGFDYGKVTLGRTYKIGFNLQF